jgi:glycosyltransferase involved in cell wall biosynthesis
VHIVYVIAPQGGPEAYVKTLIPSLERQGHRVSVIYQIAAPQIISDYPSSVRIEFAPPSALHYYVSRFVGNYHAWAQRVRAHESAWAINRALHHISRSEKVDLVEVTEGLPISSFCRRWCVVVRAHGSDWTFRHFCEDGDPRNDAWLIRQEARQLVEARAAIAISKHLASHLSNFCQIPSNQIQVIPYPINPDLFRPRVNRAAGSNFPMLLSVGRLEKRKGTDVFMSALNLVLCESPDLKVFLLGSEAGIKQESLLSLVPERKRSQVSFPGFVNRETLPSYYQKTTLYVAPSLYETFAYTVLEAMACGVPVIASDVGAIPELVENGVTGMLVPPGDPKALAQAISGLLADPLCREKMGKRAREKAVAEYSVESIAARTLASYERALSR